MFALTFLIMCETGCDWGNWDNVIGFVDFQISKVVKLVHWSAIPSFYMDEERGCLEWMSLRCMESIEVLMVID